MKRYWRIGVEWLLPPPRFNNDGSERGDGLLQENTDDLLQETGDRILLEDANG